MKKKKTPALEKIKKMGGSRPASRKLNQVIESFRRRDGGKVHLYGQWMSEMDRPALERAVIRMILANHRLNFGEEEMVVTVTAVRP